MDSTLLCFLWWMLLHAKCSCTCEDVELSTPKTLQYTPLTEYGYVFTPSSQANFITFQVKACHNALIGLSESEDDEWKGYIVAIGGWDNTRTVILRQLEDVHYISASREEDDVVSCDEYRSFWISWRNNGEVVLGRGEVVLRDVFLTLRDNIHQYQVRFVRISTGWGSTGEWKFPRLCAQRWRVEPMFTNIIMTSGIEWTVEANNPGDCAIKCRRHPHCVSFVFNAEKRYCQAHNQHFASVTEGQGHDEQGSHYFTRA